MNYVKIRGKDFQDCLLQMKMKYGSEAHVYNQRVIPVDGFLGTGLFSKKIIEIDVGIPEKSGSKEKMEKKVQDLKALLKTQRDVPREIPQAPKVKSRPLPSLTEFLEDRENGINSFESNGETRNSRQSFARNEKASEEESAEELLDKEIEPISFLTEIPLRKRSNAEKTSLEKLEERWVTEGISKEYSQRIVEELSLILSPKDTSSHVRLSEKALEVWDKHISVDSDIFSHRERGKRKVVFLVGPTGAGKTTTLAKIVARYHLHQNTSVTLVSLDNYRIAAIEQCKKYADTLSVPFHSFRDVRRFKEELYKDGSELVLVDTSGLSPKNLESISKMKEYMEALEETDSVEAVLVLSAASSYSHAKQCLEGFESLGIKRILLTKLDEADFLGGIIELADTYHKDFIFLGVGQDVPFDLRLAETGLLSECVVYPEKIRGVIGEEFTVKM